MSRIGQGQGRIAGVDFGTVRIGVAISDPSRTFSSPYENYTRKSKAKDGEYFRRIVDEEQIECFVVGLPVHLDGRESQKSTEARAFAKWLGETTKRDVALFDERFTSAHAKQLLAEGNFTRKKRKNRLDMIAAQILLAAYLEAGCPVNTDSNTGIDDDPGDPQLNP